MTTGAHQARPLLEAKGQVMGAVLASDISASWQRCLDAGLDPLSPSQDAVLSFEAYSERKQRSERFLALARPEMEQLAVQIAGHDYLIAFGDDDGMVVDVVTDAKTSCSEIVTQITPGSVWNEDLKGTNALGLSAKLGKRIAVSGAEHFFAACSGITCISAPVFRSNGCMVGVLNVTSPSSDRERHTGTLVHLAALNISNRLFVEEHRNDLILFCHPREEYLSTQSAGLLAICSDGRLTGVTPTAHSILPDISKLKQPLFSDIFQDGFGSVLDRIGMGETALLKDRHGAGIFVRMRLTRGRLLGIRSSGAPMKLGLPALQVRHNQSEGLEPKKPSNDAFLDTQIATSAEAAAAGLPVRIHGRPGNGLTHTAYEIHKRLHGHERCILIDCATVKETHLYFNIYGRTLDGDPVFGPLLEARGNTTLVLDSLEVLGDRALPVVKRIMSQLQFLAREEENAGHWALIAIHRTSGDDVCEDPAQGMVLDDFWGHSFCVPALCDRLDLPSLLHRTMTEIAPRHRLEDEAVAMIRQVGEHLTFYSLRRLLFQLSKRSDGPEISADQVRDLLPWAFSGPSSCPACRGHPTKEAKCRSIRKAVRDCDNNISLAARRMGVSRNTIYKHMELPS